ncbi:hypothetical protein BN1708_007059 [Verticillium longisporum]|uniref:Uncharacterized protein n=1 Tax=Verticillium longisporum TaxID=100787 RepID=A0A0G4MQT9_VERLO|nr:hypothetical protein BN1708_007059 [Verticillium longisporum]
MCHTRVIKPQPPIQTRNGLELRGLEVKPAAVEVLPHPLGPHRLGNDDDAALRAPPQQHLGGRPAVPRSDGLDEGHVHERRHGGGARVAELEERLRAKGRVGRDGDARLARRGHELRLREVGVVLDLQDGGRDARVGQQVAEQLGVKVGHADRAQRPGADARRVDEGLEGAPRVGEGHAGARVQPRLGGVGVPRGEARDGRVDPLRRDGEVDEVEVEVVEAPGAELLNGGGAGAGAGGEALAAAIGPSHEKHQHQSGLSASLAKSGATAERQSSGQPGQVAHVVREVAKLDSHRTPVWRVDFDDDGQILGSTGDDGKLVFYRQTPQGAWAKSSELGMLKTRMATPS